MDDNIKNILKDLQTAVATDLLNKVESGQATSAELAVAVNLLKNNGIVVNVEEKKAPPPILKLGEVLPFAAHAKKAANE